MKKIVLAFVAIFLAPASAFAMEKPVVKNVPSRVNADIITLEIHVPAGSTVSVVGGPSYLAPMTDGAGNDAMDGIVRFPVGLAKNQENTFSIVASLNGEISDSILLSIVESSSAKAAEAVEFPGDKTPPPPPAVDPIPETVDSATYRISGTVETNANIFVNLPDGTRVGSTRASERGRFGVTVDLEPGKTNRFNISAEDDAGNVGEATQVVIKVPAEPARRAPETEDEVITAEPQFKDIKEHWARESINELYRRGVVSGKAEDRFDPNAPVTRAELAKIVINAFGHQADEADSADAFADVPGSAWFAGYVARAKALGIVGGYGDGSFRPNEPVNRAAALKMITLAAGADYMGFEPSFGDVRSSDWYASYVGFAQKSGIVGGYPDGTFRPGNLITRAEVAKIVTEFLAFTGK
jgi:hypothetical protein